MGHRIALLLVVAATSAGCYTGTAAYVPQHYATRFDDATLLTAARHALAAEGFTVLHANVAPSTLVALSPVDSGGGMFTRQRWVVRVAGGQLGVRLRVEARSDAGAWVGTDEVCDHYSYAREGYFASAVRLEAAREIANANSATAVLATAHVESDELHRALADRAP